MRRTTILNILLILLLIALGAFLWYNLHSPLAMYPGEAKAKLAKGEFDAVVDVRSAAEWELGHFPLAIHIPTGQLKEQLPNRIPNKSARILFYCNTSTRARMAAEAAQSIGYPNVRYLVGLHANLK
jgi:rhodanese-related sulfurtransferase